MIRVVVRALALCELLAEDAPRSLTALATALGCRRSTLGNLLGTLVRAGYLARSRAGYQLTARFAALRDPLPGHERLRRLGEEACRGLAEATGAGAALTVLGRRGKAVVAQAESAGDGTLVRRAAWRDSPLYASATGRVLLAWASPARRRTVLDRLGPPTAADWPEARDEDALIAALDRIRDESFCACRSGTGMASFAVPVFGRGGAPIAALGLYADRHRSQGASRSPLVRALRSGGQALSAELARWELAAWPPGAGEAW